MKEVSTSILSKEDKFDNIKKLNNSSTDYIHLDIMDGKFVPNTFITKEELPKVIESCNKKIDIHLMVENPIEYINLCKNYDISYITIHYELDNFLDLVNYIKNLGFKVGAAIKPKTNIEEIYKLSFEAHYLLVSIHPWADGNGRMSRLVMNMIQKEFDVIPSIVKKENRVEYIQSLASSQVKDDMQDFMDFMMYHHIQNLLQQINEYSESLADDTLNYKNDTLNDTLKLSPKEITVLEIIKSNLTVTTAQIVEQTGFSRPTVMRAIKNLKENKILERVNSKKTGSWKVNV